MDETSLYMNPDGELVIAETGKPASKVSSCNKENLSTLICVNVAGETVPPLTLWGFERIPLKVSEKKPLCLSYGKSDNGWMTSEMMYEYIYVMIFIQIWSRRRSSFLSSSSWMATRLI